MVKKKRGALCVESNGKRHFICVPSGRAQDLHHYLRNSRVHAAPPEPSFNGFDCIELPNCPDIDIVQTLLNDWGKVPAAH
jgi:hypothetical protein